MSKNNFVEVTIDPPIFTETVIIPGKQGIQGAKGDPGVFVGTTEPTDPSVKVWINPEGMESDIKGDKGDKGDTGNGIKSIDITYAGGTSNTTAPTSGWQATPPSVAAGNYLWTRFIVSMTDNTSKTAYSVAKQGSTGAAAGFGTVTATVNNAVGTPSVTVTPSGANTAKNFNFDFKNLKGDKGDTGAAAGFDTPAASVGNNVGTPTVNVTTSGDNTKKKFTFTFDNLRGATFTPSVSEAGVLSWMNDKNLAVPSPIDIPSKVQAAMGGYTIRKATSAPAAGTSDNIITLVTEA